MTAKWNLTTLCAIALVSGAAGAQTISTPAVPANVDPPASVQFPKSAHPESDRLARHIVLNLTLMGESLLQFAADNEGPLPDHLGRIVGDVPSMEVFVTPGTHIPVQILNGSPLQQSDWVRQHSAYAFPGRGKNINALSSQDIILHERLDLEPRRPVLGVLFADGSATMVDRGTLEMMLRQP